MIINIKIAKIQNILTYYMIKILNGLFFAIPYDLINNFPFYFFKFILKNIFYNY